MHQLLEDARFYAGLRTPGRTPALWRVLLVPFIERGFWLVLGQRASWYATYRRNLRHPLWWVARIAEGVIRYGNAVLNKSEATADCLLPGPVYFAPGGHYMLGAMSIGPGTVIQRQVTLGMAVGNGNQERPTLGANVWIGSECVIAGGVMLGDGSTVCPGSYVTIDVPAGAVARGNPARVIRQGYDNTACRRSPRTVAVPPGIET
jgi:acetyltransferase-like isoleucine patch superfamily enzyme